MDELHQAEKTLVASARLLKALAADPHHRNPFVFVIATTFLESLAKLVYNKGGRAMYKKFVRSYLSRVNPRYRRFTYRFTNGVRKQDLPEQMYHVLRSGIVHSFSLVPDGVALANGGRSRSIVIAHRVSRMKHLSHWYIGSQPTCVLVAEVFAEDIAKATSDIFKRAKTNKALAMRIIRWIRAHPPIQGGIVLTSKPT